MVYVRALTNWTLRCLERSWVRPALARPGLGEHSLGRPLKTQLHLWRFIVHNRCMNGTAVFELTARDRKKLAARLALPADVRAVAVRTPSGEIELPAAAQRAVEQLLAELASGSSVHVLADDHELTTAQAGELLGLSRTFVVRLIDDGVLPAHYAGTHRRLRTSDVLAYSRQRQQRLDAVAAIAHGDVAIGIPYR